MASPRSDIRPMTPDEVAAAVDGELQSARKLRDGKIGRERRIAYDYYLGEPFGNEEAGQSQIVSQLVMEVIDSLMPDLMKVFCGGENAVEFVARQPQDVPLAEQATATCNYVFFTQNPGFRLLYEAIKDALLQKTGAWKYWWLVEQKVRQETFQGLTEDQLALLTQDKQVEIVAATPYPAPFALPAPAPAPGQPANQPGGSPNPQPPAPATLYDVTVRRTKESGHICIETIPPDELLVNERAKSVDTQSLPFIAHETRKTLSELVEMGYPIDVVMDLPASDTQGALSEDAVARATHNDQVFPGFDQGSSYDPMQRVVRYVEAYQLLDVDGDGISELRKFCSVGKQTLNGDGLGEVIECVPIAVITPKIMPHEFYGMSLADDSADLQLLKSTLWRQVLNGIYHSIYPRSLVIESGASANTYADLQSPMPGGYVRMKAAGAVQFTQPSFDPSSGMSMIEFVEQEVEGRTPVSRYYQGIDPNSINKTATHVNTQMTRSQARAELIARTFAETGIKDLFRGILWLLGKYQQEPMIVRLNNKYVPIDPRAWTTEYDMTVNVGLGTGNKQEQLAFLGSIEQAQAAAVQGGGMGMLITPKNLYNLQAKKAELAGFKDPSQFWTEPPDQYQPPPPQPNPLIQAEQIKGQVAQQNAQLSAQTDLQREQIRAEVEKQSQLARAQADVAIQQHKTETQAALDRMRAEQEAQLQLQIANIKAAAQVETARVTANATLEGQRFVAATSLEAGLKNAGDPPAGTAERRGPIGEVNASVSQLAQHMANLHEALQQHMANAKAPKTIVRGADGRVAGIQHADGTVQQVSRGPDGRVIGLQ